MTSHQCDTYVCELNMSTFCYTNYSPNKATLGYLGLNTGRLELPLLTVQNELANNHSNGIMVAIVVWC